MDGVSFTAFIHLLARVGLVHFARCVRGARQIRVGDHIERENVRRSRRLRQVCDSRQRGSAGKHVRRVRLGGGGQGNVLGERKAMGSDGRRAVVEIRAKLADGNQLVVVVVLE